MLLLQTILMFFLFLGISFFVFYSLGFLIIGFVKKDLENQEKISLSLSLGIVIFVILAALFGLINLRFLTLPVILIVAIYSVYKSKVSILKPWLVFKDKLLLILIITGILVQGFINFPSGYNYNGNLLFWSSQAFDGLWHISIMSEIQKEFPPKNPVFSGEALKNYHYLVDVLMAEYGRIFPVFSNLDLYYRFFPVLFSFLIGISVFAFVSKWKNKGVGYWAIIFTYFTGSFGYIPLYLKQGKIFGGETFFWVSQLNTIIGNPPHAMAISLFCSFLLSFLIFIKTKNKWFLAIGFILISIISGFKVSAGIVILSGLLFAILINIVFTRQLLLLTLLIPAVISNYITLKSMTRGVESYLIFEPWWFIRTMVVAKLDWIDLENRRQHYISKGTWNAWLRVIQIETEAFLIFLVGNLGMRVIGFYYLIESIIKKRFGLNNIIDNTLFFAMLTSFLIPLFFLQKGIVYNSVQFLQYFLLIFGFYAAVAVFNIQRSLKNRLFKITFVLLILIFSVPTVIGNFVEFYGNSPLTIISKEEQEALNYLKENSEEDDVILEPAFNKYLKDKFSLPLPIYAWYSTAYVSALTDRTSFLACEDMVDQTGFDIKGRIKQVDDFFGQKELLQNQKLLKDEKISFIYIPKKKLESSLDEFGNSITKIFENDEVLIYKVNNT